MPHRQPTPRPAIAAAVVEDDANAHTAPHDELIDVVRDLMHTAPGGVTLDQLANALRERGFRRTPGSPRLITRLKRIRDIDVNRNGLIRVGGEPVEAVPHHRHEVAPAPAVEEADDGFSIEPEDEGGEEAAEASGDAPLDTEAASGEGGQRRRRRRRGGRRRRGRRGNGNGAGGNGDTGGEVLAAAPSSDSFPEF